MRDRQEATSPDQIKDLGGKLFDMPEELVSLSTLVHASALVIGRHGILLRGPTGSGKSVLQRYLRQRAEQKKIFSAVVSDDYVRLARCDAGSFVAFAPVATRNKQEVHGLGIVSTGNEKGLLKALDVAAIHMLVDLVPPEDISRSPLPGLRTMACLGGEIAYFCVPKGSSLVAADMIFAALSTL